jgi:hypothetical protein
MRNLTFATMVLAASACARASHPGARRSPVTVTESGLSLALAPRPDDCVIEFYRAALPERPHDEVATLHFRGTPFANPRGAQEKIRQQACALGADAVLVSRDFVPGTQATPSLMTGTAVSYRDARERHRLDAAQRSAEAARRAQEAAAAARQRLADAPRSPSGSGGVATTAADPPKGFVHGIARATALARALPDRLGEERGVIERGSDVWVDPKRTPGWQRVWTPELRVGWVEGDVVELPAATAPVPRAVDDAPLPPVPEPRPPPASI